MIDKIGASTDPSPADLKKIAKGNDIDWDKYVKAIEDLKINPPRQFAVTISQFTAYPGAELPAWRIPDMIERGLIDPNSVPPTHDVRSIVTEPWLKILQAGVGEGYLRDIVEIDPHTGKPLAPQKNIDNVTQNNTQPQQTASALATTTTASTASR